MTGLYNNRQGFFKSCRGVSLFYLGTVIGKVEGTEKGGIVYQQEEKIREGSL